MDAADSVDGKTLADTAANGDESSRTLSSRSPASEPAEPTLKDEGCDLPTLPDEAPSAATLAASDPAGLILRDEPRTTARSSSPGGNLIGEGFARTVAVPPSTDPSSCPNQQTSDGHAPPVPRERPVPVIAGYEILGELGRGGMGVVYRARQIRLNRPCAVKMILAGAHADAVAAHRFRTEAEAVARLQHPNIVQIHFIGEADGLPYFELEYLDGGSLDKQLDGTPWPPRRAAELIEILARGVAEAHRLGIVHRDLKPANVLLATDGAPKITDFGLAKSLAHDHGLTRTDSIMGSPGYMAPEQAEGKTKQVGPLADVYSLGAILYELVTGRPPFRAAAALETLEQVKTSEPVPPSRLVPGLPRDVETIALKCLQKDPARRYASAGDLAEDLRRFLDGKPIVARPVPIWERGIKWARRRPAIAALVAVVHLLLASLLGGGIWSYAEINRSLTLVKDQRTKAESLAQAEAKASALAREQTAKAQEQTKVANQRAEDLAWEDYINRIDRAYREVQDDNVALAEDLLHGCPVERRGWEWHYVKRLCDVAGARRACEDLLKRSANATTADLALANNVVWSCVLTPNAVTDPGAPVRLAEAALKLHHLTGREGSDRLRILGAALYRAGRFAEAIHSLEESHQNRSDDGDPRGFAFLAMAHHRLGHRDLAKRWLDKLAAYQPKEGSGLSWDDVEIRIFRREAEAVVLGSAPATPSPAASAPTKKTAGHPESTPK